MQSLLAKELKMKYRPVAVLFSDTRPDEARQFREHKWGCAMALYRVTMKLGKPAVFNRNTYGCIGAGVGLCLGDTYKDNRDFMENLLADEEGYFESRTLAKEFMDNLPYADIPHEYVVFKPLEMINPDEEEPALVSFPVNADQLSALVVLANFRRKGQEHVVAPFCSGCQSVCVIPYNESLKDEPRGIIGNIDISSRKILPAEVLTFTVPFKMFLQMEEDAPKSFLRKETWARVAKRIGDEGE